MKCDFKGCEAPALPNRTLGLCLAHEAEILDLTEKMRAHAKTARWHMGKDMQERARKSLEAWNDFFVRADFLRERSAGQNAARARRSSAPAVDCQCPHCPRHRRRKVKLWPRRWAHSQMPSVDLAFTPPPAEKRNGRPAFF